MNFSATQRPRSAANCRATCRLAQCLQMERITVPDDMEKLDVALRRIAPGGTITVKPGLYSYVEPLRPCPQRDDRGSDERPQGRGPGMHQRNCPDHGGSPGTDSGDHPAKPCVGKGARRSRRGVCLPRDA